MDVWNYILRENIEIPSLYFAHDRKVVWRNGSWIPVSEYLVMQDDEEIVTKKIRFRTLGDITITGGIESEADTLDKIRVDDGTLSSVSGTTTIDISIELGPLGDITFAGAGDLIVQQGFGNGGDPYLPENDASLAPESWTGHTGCVGSPTPSHPAGRMDVVRVALWAPVRRRCR